jgi:hypothetical protein
MPSTLVISEYYPTSQWVPSTKATVVTKERSIVVLDYDDTLLPSSWLKSQSYGDFTETPSTDMLAYCEMVAKSVAELINEAKNHAEVIIVTNASNGWVQESCKIYMPSIHELICSLKIVSAQHIYRLLTPSTYLWKRYAFRDHVLEAFGRDFKEPVSFLSIGDSDSEHLATLSLPDVISGNIKTKILRFMAMSDPETLIRQQALTKTYLKDMVMSPSCLDLYLKVITQPTIQIPSNNSILGNNLMEILA